jgi:hypothetical protein
MAGLGAVALVAAVGLVLLTTINSLRALPDVSVGATGAPAVSASPTSSPEAVFPDLTLIGGSSDGLVYRVQSGHIVGSPVEACPSQSVLVVQPSASGRLLMVICGGTSEGSVVVLDGTTLARRAGPMPVVSRDDVAAWSPDETSIALLQTGRCDPQAPVCSAHLSLWSLADNTSKVLRPDAPLMGYVRWTALGLSVSFSQGPEPAATVWDGQAWNTLSQRHRLSIADASGRALLVEAGTGNTGGRVWLREGDQERALTQGATDTEYPLALDGTRAMVWRDAIPGPGGSVVIYDGTRVQNEIAVQGFCATAQQVGRWLVCTKSGSSALAFSLDANEFATLQITGLPRFNALAALPKA